MPGVVADDSGVLVVPQKRQEEVLVKAQDIAGREERIAKMLDEGLSLKEARIREGYHQIGKQQELGRLLPNVKQSQRDACRGCLTVFCVICLESRTFPHAQSPSGHNCPAQE